MAIAALNSAATGLRALSTRIDVVANNLANAETTAFKRSRTSFEDLLYVTQRQPGALDSLDQVSPAGIQIGLGTKVSNTAPDFEQGGMESTGVPLDIAIEGPGFLKVQINPEIGDGFAYTRKGSLFVNKDSELVIDSSDGYRLDPPIKVPVNTPDDAITIAEDGTISLKDNNANTTKILGQFELTRFVNPRGLKELGGSLFQESPASGPPIQSKPGEEGAGKIQQSFLEGSNVDPVKELVTLIKTQRSFELNSQSIQTADQALQTIANLRRF